jgi:hypothetical protein
MGFIGREVELAALEKRWKTADSDIGCFVWASSGRKIINSNALSRIVPQQFYLTRVAPKLDAFFGIVFEPVAAELFLRAKVLQQVTESWNISSYWDKSIQIDFTIALATGFTYLGEVKWAKPEIKTVHTFIDRTKELMKERAHRPVLISLEKVTSGIRKLEGIDAFGIAELL